MVQLYALIRKRILVSLLLQFILVLSFAGSGLAQDVIFRETMGTVTSASILEHEKENRFSNPSFTMTGDATTSKVSVTPTYQGNSGQVVIDFPKGKFFQVSDINTLNFTGLILSMGIRKTTKSGTGADFLMQYSTDGNNWLPLKMPALTAGTNWEKVTITTASEEPIPITENLRLKFTNKNTGFVQYKIDDIELLGTSTLPSTLPTVTGLSPTTGGINTEVTITGTNLLNVVDVLFGDGTALEVIAPIEATQIKARIIDAPTESVFPIYLLDANGETLGNTVDFTFLKTTITDISPSAGLVGTEVKFTGTNLEFTSSVIFSDGADAQITYTSPTEVRAKVPANAINGPVQIVTPLGTETAPQDFTVYRPIISSLNPISAKEGELVTITGSRLILNKVIPSIVFEGDKTAIVTDSSTTTGIDIITFTVPVGAQTGPITLTTIEGTTQSESFTVIRPSLTFTFVDNPKTPEIETQLEGFQAFKDNFSAVQQYKVDGVFLNGSLNISVPAPFQIANSEQESAFGPSVTITNAGTVSTTIYVRYKSLGGDPVTTNITHASFGMAPIEILVQGVTIGSLPVELISFTAEQQRNSTMLKWATASEKDNAYFEIETSNSPTEDFAKLDKVESKVVNSSSLTKYTYKHQHAGPGGTRYYRLKQTDLNGTFKYSHVVSVEAVAQAPGNQLRVAPNPLNYNSKVYVTAAASGKAILRLTAIAGKQVYQKEVDVQAGENEIQLPVYDKLKSGIYILTIELEGQRHQVKVVKQ